MADDQFHLESKEFDVVVCGTGLTECLVSAYAHSPSEVHSLAFYALVLTRFLPLFLLNRYRALARIGKSVLHLDENRHYGGSAASLPLDSLHEILTNGASPELKYLETPSKVPL